MMNYIPLKLKNSMRVAIRPFIVYPVTYSYTEPTFCFLGVSSQPDTKHNWLEHCQLAKDLMNFT